MFSNNYRYIQLNFTLVLQHLYILHIYFSIIYFTYAAREGAQFLNITPLFRSYNLLALPLFLAPVIIIVPHTSIYESL